MQHLPAAPDVNGGAVALLAEQQLRRPVPEGDHLVRVRPVLVLGAEEARQAKVGQLNLALVVHENVGALDVPVEEVVAVAVAETVEQLPHDVTDVRLAEVHQAAFQQAHQVVVHVLEDEVEGALVALKVQRILLVGDDLAQVDDVLVVQLAEDFDLSHLHSKQKC